MIKADVRDFGAAGNGQDDTVAVHAALHSLRETGGCLYFPTGLYSVRVSPCLRDMVNSLCILGDGPGASVVKFIKCSGFDISFLQDAWNQQSAGLSIEGIGLRAADVCGTAIRTSYGTPLRTNDHFRPSVRISNVNVESNLFGAWTNGIDITGAWNPSLSDLYVSGDSCGAEWNNLRGSGIRLNGMCVNAHLTNVKMNFWAEGLRVHAGDGLNTEGIFCSNCSMVGVKRGVWVKGNPNQIPGRISTFTWQGGLIEARVGGVAGGSAAFHFEDVWTALVSGCQMITETITDNVENTYGVVAQDCHGVVVSGCDINAWIFGVATTGHCKAISVHGNTFTNTPNQVVFNKGTTCSREYGNVLVNNDRSVRDLAGGNAMELSPWTNE